MNTDQNIGSFLNDKAEIINEILQSVRSINNNGFQSGLNHLNESRRLLKVFENKHEYFDKLVKQSEDKNK